MLLHVCVLYISTKINLWFLFFLKIMTTLQDKFNKLYSARTKLEAELNNIYGEINNAIDKQDRKVKIERLFVKCKDAFIRVVDKNEELFDLAQKTENPDAACKNLEKWLETVTKKTDEFIAAARGYINSVHDKETAEQYTSHHSKSSSHMTSSKKSSQRQRDLELSKLKKEELEKQHEAKLRIARQRLEIEKKTKLRELEIEQLEEDHRKEVAAAALEEIGLMTKSSADGSGTGKMGGLFTKRSSVKSKKLVQDWVNSSPAGNMADVANELSLHFSGSIAQSNQAIVQRPSSAHLPNSHFNLNTHGQVEANINLPAHDPSSRTNVTNEAHNARTATASIYASITSKLWYAYSTKRPKHSPTTVSSNNALRWFTVRSSIPSQVEHAGTVEFSQPSAFTTFKHTR